jgi:hypothetical protein
LLDLRVLRGGDSTDMTSMTARALLDTGATVSGIGPRVVAELGLASHSKKRLKSATDEVFVDYYLFRIGFDLPGSELETDAWRLPFIFNDWMVSAGGGQPISMSSSVWMSSRRPT